MDSFSFTLRRCNNTRNIFCVIRTSSGRSSYLGLSVLGLLLQMQKHSHLIIIFQKINSHLLFVRDENRKSEKQRNSPSHSRISSDLQPSVKIWNTVLVIFGTKRKFAEKREHSDPWFVHVSL